MRYVACALIAVGVLVSAMVVSGCGNAGGMPRSTHVTLAGWTLLAANPALERYEEDQDAGVALPELKPEAFSADALASARGIVVPPPVVAPELCGFPARYDLRDLGRTTPARDSTGLCGTCWTASTIASMESILAQTEQRDLSEAHLQLNYGSDAATCGQGGNRQIATFYAAAWRGPVDEADFNPSGPPSIRGAQLPALQKQVQNVLYLPPRQGPLDNCWIKLAVTNLGAVYTDISRAIFSPQFLTNHTYYHPTDSTVHSVAIVGWDDDFDRNLFFCGDPSVPLASRVPAGNGAFIVKDNGGPGWLDQGYFYVSYYDGSIGNSNAVFVPEPLGTYSRNYQHDPFGPTFHMVLPGQKPDASWQANVFTAREDEWLVAVGLYELFDTDMDYHIEIHLDPTHGPRAAGGATSTAEFSVLVGGYFTVRLPSPVRLTKGQRFSVLLRGQDRTGGWPSSIMVERPTIWLKQVKAAAGQSWVSTDGTTWVDLTTVALPSGPGTSPAPLVDSNLCIKAFTKPLVQVGTPSFGDGFSIAWPVQNDGSEDVWVKPVARGLRWLGDIRVPEDTEVEAASVVIDPDAPAEDTLDGWILLPAGATATAISAMDAAVDLDEIEYNLYVFEEATGRIRTVAAWLGALNVLLQQPLTVVDTTPAQGASVSAPGSLVVTITLDRPAKAGPQLTNISVKAGSKTYSVAAGVAGTTLTLFTPPITSTSPGGVDVTVQVPSHAVLSQVGSSPLAADFTLTFSVTGVN